MLFKQYKLIVPITLTIHLLTLNSLPGFMLEIPCSFHTTGYGARSKGMGSAFTGLCDDATAVSHNPAGLVQLRKIEFSLVHRYDHREETIQFMEDPNSKKTHPAHDSDLDYLSVTYPFRFNEMDMGFTLAYQHLYDFQRHWSFVLEEQTKPPFYRSHGMSYHQTGLLSALGFSFCLAITPKLSFGITLNWWDNNLTDNNWRQTYTYDRNVLFEGLPYSREITHKEELYSIKGINANLGLLWEFAPAWQLGCVLKTPFKADLTYEKTRQLLDINMQPIGEPEYESLDNNTLSMPMSFGFGISYQMSEKVLFTADFFHTLWDNYWIQTKGEKKISPILGIPLDESHIKPTTQLRFGMEYLSVHPEKGIAVPLRCGGYYDPVPWEHHSQDYWGLTFGSGIEFLNYQQFSLDFAYEYRWGDKPVPEHLEATHYKEKTRSHQMYFSLIVYLE